MIGGDSSLRILSVILSEPGALILCILLSWSDSSCSVIRIISTVGKGGPGSFFYQHIHIHNTRYTTIIYCLMSPLFREYAVRFLWIELFGDRFWNSPALTCWNVFVKYLWWEVAFLTIEITPFLICLKYPLKGRAFFF